MRLQRDSLFRSMCTAVRVTVVGHLCAAGVLALGLGSFARPARADAGGEVQFNRDIRPILSENCFACHGPDAPAREGDLRLDTPEGIRGKADKGVAVVPGDPGKSVILSRVTSADDDEVMPPAKTGKKLTARQVELLTKWIEQGAKWEGHWSFTAPVKVDPPAVKGAKWVRNGVDGFVLARLEAEGLTPSAEADRATLIRRVTLDLTGLPPTPEEVSSFVGDSSEDAYEKVVDRLLASPKFGERMALEWLDVARYADTHGYHIDSGRDMWLWREWVIDAFNRNMPFDQFTVEQLAGDMLPNATLSQKIASGFNRNHMINYEGGAIPEEYHTAYVMDRVNTTGAVWMGLTVQCSQCHDHKYDPLTQKEYFQLYAYFNNVPENGLDGKKGNAVPFLKVPTPEQQAKLDELAKSIQAVEQKLSGPDGELDAAQAKWEESAQGQNVEWVTLDPAEMVSAGKATLAKRDDKSVVASGMNPEKETYTLTARTELKGITAIRVEALPDDALVAKGPGRSENGNAVLTDVRLGVASVAAPAERKLVKFKSASADFSQPNFPVKNAIDDQPQSGWAIFPEVGKKHAAVFELAEPVGPDGGAVLTIALDFQSIHARHHFGRVRVSVTSSPQPHFAGKLPESIAKVLATPVAQRSEQQKTELRTYYRSTVSPEGRKYGTELAKLIKSRAELEAKVPTTMVMQEMDKPRDTFLLQRGQYDAKGEKVAPATPAFLPATKDAAANRLGLAKWLVDDGNPLTSRVTVNRYWQMFFGTGLVKTADDFGSQGELPSHPDLLDWLAVEFREKNWDTKGFVRMLVTSATYRQASAVSRELLAKDPENRLLARGPRFRLQAEFVRDQALAVAGLLDPRMGGVSVFPYQPPGLWEELMSRSDGDQFTAQKYVQSHGADLYRRSMYTFWKRTSPPPGLAAFDAPDREICTVRRGRTNTPLQALVLMNDPTYVEAARKLAERMLKELPSAASPDDRIAFAFRLATARRPTAEEAGVLRRIYQEQLAVYRSNAEAATKLLSVGESPRDDKLDPLDLAAWTTVATTILNLDETITKG